MNGGDGRLLRLLALDRADREARRRRGRARSSPPARRCRPRPSCRRSACSRAVNGGGSLGAARSRADDPVLLGDEGVDLGLAVADHLERHRLHAPGGEALLDLVPEERREAGSPSGGRGRAAPAARRPGAGRSCAGFSSALSTALLVISLKVTRWIVLRVLAEHLGDVPGDRLALAVRIGGEVDRVRPSSPRPCAASSRPPSWPAARRTAARSPGPRPMSFLRAGRGCGRAKPRRRSRARGTSSGSASWRGSRR